MNNNQSQQTNPEHPMVKQIASMVYFELELLKELACNINNMDEKIEMVEEIVCRIIQDFLSACQIVHICEKTIFYEYKLCDMTLIIKRYINDW